MKWYLSCYINPRAAQTSVYVSYTTPSHVLNSLSFFGPVIKCISKVKATFLSIFPRTVDSTDNFGRSLPQLELFFFSVQVKRSATSSNISFLASELKVFSSNHANIKGSSISFEAIFLGIVCLWCVPLINSNLLMWEENVSLYT